MVSFSETEDESMTTMESLTDSVENTKVVEQCTNGISDKHSHSPDPCGASDCKDHARQCIRESAKGGYSYDRFSRSRSQVHRETKE